MARVHSSLLLSAQAGELRQVSVPQPQLEEAVQASFLLVSTGRKSFSEVLGLLK